MARVFVSYRRADGAYGVGWLAERLRTLDSITGVETAFHDSALRAGDDFPTALDREIAESDLIVAVIGPEWLGDRGQGSPRIQDPDDWIVRELATAHRQEKHIMPIWFAGAEHPLASQVHESIEWISRLHGLPFEDERDLTTIVAEVKTRLVDIDAERAQLSGLAEPIDVPKLPHPRLIAVGAGAAGLAGAALARVLTSYSNCDGELVCDFQDATAYRWLEVIMVIFGAYIGVTAVVGGVLAFRLHRIASHRWVSLFGMAAFVGITLLLLTVSARSGQYALTTVPSLPRADLRFWINTVMAVVGAIVAVGVVSPFFSTPRAAPHELADRVRALGIARDAERWGAVLLSIEFSLIAAGGAAVLAALDQSALAETVGPMPNITFALVFSSVLLIAHTGAVTKLNDRQAELERDLDDVPPRYRRNATPQLMARGIDVGSGPFRAMLALPLIVTIGAAILESVG